MHIVESVQSGYYDAVQYAVEVGMNVRCLPPNYLDIFVCMIFCRKGFHVYRMYAVMYKIILITYIQIRNKLAEKTLPYNNYCVPLLSFQTSNATSNAKHSYSKKNKTKILFC